jgi:low temperature requirement protein LtrA
VTQPRPVVRFRDWFWRPPRAHGEIDPERSVSYLELFYDLVYVVVIAQAAHHLADVYRPLTRVMAGAMALALIVGWWQPAPWLLALSLMAILLAVWLFAVNRLFRSVQDGQHDTGGQAA